MTHPVPALDASELVRRDGARLGDHAFDRHAGPAGAADGVDVAAAQLDPAHGVVAGVGNVEHVALQADALRAIERGQLHRPVDEAGPAAAELAQHAAAVVALEDAVVAAVGHVRSEEHTSELQSLMRNSYAVFCLK